MAWMNGVYSAGQETLVFSYRISKNVLISFAISSYLTLKLKNSATGFEGFEIWFQKSDNTSGDFI